jgi:hypothetical protein
MILGGYTFALDPAICALIRPHKRCASVETYSGVVFFSWGASIVGVAVDMSWPAMSTAQFAALDALYQADAPVVLDPQDGSNKTYNVEIEALDGRFFVGAEDAIGNLRRDVTMRLLILSEVA